MKTKLLFAAVFFTTVTFGQEIKEERKKVMRVEVTQDKDGKTQTIKKEYDLSNMNDAEADAKVKVIIDSTKSGAGKEKRVMVTIDDNRSTSEKVFLSDDGKEMIIRKFKNGDDQNFSWKNDNRKERVFEFKAPRIDREKIERRMKTMNQDLDRSMNRVFYNSEKAPSIRSLQAFPNNPDKNQLNIRFNAPKKGNVVINVMDANGKTIAHKDVKDFEGDYVGQIDLGRSSKGTYFVFVVQNEDGATKRVVIE